MLRLPKYKTRNISMGSNYRKLGRRTAILEYKRTSFVSFKDQSKFFPRSRRHETKQKPSEHIRRSLSVLFGHYGCGFRLVFISNFFLNTEEFQRNGIVIL